MISPRSRRSQTKSTAPTQDPVLRSPEGLLRRFAGAAERGYYVLLTEAEKCFAALGGTQRASILIHTGGAWRAWDHLDNADTHETRFAFELETLTWDRITPVEGGVFIPVRPGSVAVVIEHVPRVKDIEPIAGMMAVAFDLALTSCDRKRASTDDGDEIQVLQRVALRILKSHDLQEILLLITHEAKLLLGADICGIMLREGDAVVMHRCVGNFSVDTASLRMRAGQGLAGRVFATKEPCHVENYLASNIISKDFSNLARTEMVRSALGAPLLSQDDVIGVLEVWRRRSSKFDQHDTNRLVALANLTSLAIENARLSQVRETMVRELAEANRALLERYEIIRSSAAFQNELNRLLLEGKSLADLAANAAARLKADVFVLDANLELEGSFPPSEQLPEPLRTQIKAAARKGPVTDVETIQRALDGKSLILQAVVAGSERLGWVAAVREEPFDESAQLGLSQMCVATSLHTIERRAAARARAETLGAVLWDLLEGSDDVRRAAASRARDLHVDLDGRHRIFLCAIDEIERIAMAEGWSATELDARKRRIRQTHLHMEELARTVKLSGMRGNTIALICGGEAVAHGERLGGELAAGIAEHVPGLAVGVGVSAPCPVLASLPAAYREARISLEVARQRGKVASAAYEDAGIVGLLLSLREEADMRKIVRTIFGPLLEERPQSRDVLLKTLEAFFAFNCSRQAAAKKLRVHQKTVVYRLTKIEDLIGLDFSKHEDRLLADIALRMYGMMSATSGVARS